MPAAELLALGPADVRDLQEAWRLREQRRDVRAARLCALLANINRDEKRKPTPFHEADFFHSLEEYRPKQDVQQLFHGLAEMTGGAAEGDE